MARGRGRGRGRGRKMPILTDGSSVGAQGEASDQQQAQSTEQNHEDGVNGNDEIARRLNLDGVMEEETDYENADLTKIVAENKTENNGTVVTKQYGNITAEESMRTRGEEGNKDKEPWVNMFKNNRAANSGMQLNYFPPQRVNGESMVQLDGAEVQNEEAKWKSALIAYVVGECPGYNVMNRYIKMNWSKAGQSTLYLHEEGYFIVKFQNLDDMNEILYSGPYTINNRPIILKQWSPDFDFGKEFLAEIPLWVNFPKLPLNCWGFGSLSRIASAIGVPLFADECTTKQTRISYARMLIEVDVTKAIPQQITVADPSGRTFVQEVVMEWKPQYCDKCQKIGHQCKSVTQEEIPRKKKPWKKVTQTWQYKGPIQQQEKIEECGEVMKKPGEDGKNVEKEIQEIENEEVHGVKQTPELNLRPQTGSKQLEFSLANFPILSAIPTRNGFESLRQSKLASLPVDRGGEPQTC